MTIRELHYDFKYKIDKVDSLQRQNFIPAEIDWILNEAIRIFIKQRFGITNNKKLGFETSQKRIQDLRTLQINSPTSKQPAIIPSLVSGNMYELKLSNLAFNFLFLTRLTAKVSKTGCVDKVARVKEIQHDDLSDVLLANPFYKPSFEWGEVVCNFARTDQTADSIGSIYLYTDGTFTIPEVYVEYLKFPNKVCLGGYTDMNGSSTVTVECDLPEHSHSEIVDIAVTEAARIISDPNFLQIKQQKLNINE